MNMQDRLDGLLKAAADARRVPGVAAIVLDTSGRVLYKGGHGSTNLSDPDAPRLTCSTRAWIFSCTKLMTTVAALQLIEQGKLNLDDPVEKHVPEWKKLQVLEGFDDDGKPRLRAPRTTATVLMLMTHTAGLTYDFFNPSTLRWRLTTRAVPAIYTGAPTRGYYETPLAHDPGTRFEYGICSDWLGFVIENITGTSLPNHLDRHVLKPLGLKDTSEAFENGGKDGFCVHVRGEDGTLTADPNLQPPPTLPVRGGGSYMISTVEDYSRFLLAVVNGGVLPGAATEGSPRTRILEEATVKEYLFTDMMPRVCPPEGIGKVTVAIPQLANAGTLLPGEKKGWSCGTMLNLEDREKGRSAGSAAWAGLGNVFYWMDPVKGRVGMLLSEIFPFMDSEALYLFDTLERAVYGHEAAKLKGEKGSNYSLD